jgi:hypothetical protein
MGQKKREALLSEAQWETMEPLFAVSNTRHWQVKRSLTANTRNRCPAAVKSLAKSRAHSNLPRSASARQ